MAATQKNQDLAVGSLFGRLIKAFVERLSQRAGEKVVSTDVVTSLLGTVSTKLTSSGLNPSSVFEAATVIAPAIIQDPVIWRIIVRLLKLDPDQARELTNEGLDTALSTMFDRAKALTTLPANQQNAEIGKLATDAVTQLHDTLKTSNPNFVRKVWLEVDRFALIHEVDCPAVKNRRGVTKGLTLHEAMQKGGHRARECPGCSDLTAQFDGSLFSALALCDHAVRARVHALMDSDAEISTAGAKRSDITVAKLAEAVTYGTDEGQRNNLRALAGLPPKVKGAPDLKAFLGKAQAAGQRVLDVLLEPADGPDREALRQDIRNDTQRLENDLDALRSATRSTR